MSDFRSGIGVVAMEVLAIVLALPSGVRAEGAAPEIRAGTAVHAVLESKLDARKVEVGDTVKARAARAVKSGDRVVLPRGSKLLGRVQMVETGGEASVRGESRLGVSFDRAVLPDGQEIAVDLAIQAIAAAEPEPDTPRARGSALETSRGAAQARGSAGGLIGGTLGDVVGDAPELGDRIASDVAIDADASLGRAVQADGTLSTSSEGVIGLRGLQLDSSGKSSVIVRSSGPVMLSSGTRLLLRARGAVSAH